MRLQDITGLICLSCVLMFFYVNSQTSTWAATESTYSVRCSREAIRGVSSQRVFEEMSIYRFRRPVGDRAASCLPGVLNNNSNTLGCETGWFGARCQYKCRCVNGNCDANGMCTGNFTCQGGWFGPACQYADLAYLQTGSPVLTDGNDSSCMDGAGLSNITISLKEKNIFTWMRVLISDKAPAALDELKVSFSVNTNPVNCDELKIYVVDKWTRDIHCNLTQTITGVTLSGGAVPRMCSVYVSGGRNVALKESAYQNFSYSEFVNGKLIIFSAHLAVDGDTTQDMYQLSCAHTKRIAKWTLTFSMPRTVHRYVIYNRVENSIARSIGFTIDSFDNMNTVLFRFRDTSRVACQTYQITHLPLPIQRVAVAFHNRHKILQLCEVEVYGDSICDSQHYGRDCENTCNCLNKETCLVSTGGCTSGCPPSFYGYACLDHCQFGIVNEYCNMPCGENCAPFEDANIQSCNQTNGACLLGCKSGFDGQLCQTGCAFGTFGERCNSSCSENCASPGDAKISPCNASTGTCLLGCKTGFQGALCQDISGCPSGKFGNGCNSSCSKNCEDNNNATTCHHATGDCLNGCTSGFTGAFCQTKCDVGKFGPNCSSSCSRKCEPIHLKGASPCDHVTGKCYRGCQFGFYGDLCLQAGSMASDETSSGNLIVGLCLLVVGISVVSFCFWKKKGGRSPAESLTE